MFATSSLPILIVVGLVASWLARRIMQGTGFGVLGDIAIGITGAFFGTWLLAMFGIVMGFGQVATIINATIGALALLAIIGLVRRT